MYFIISLLAGIFVSVMIAVNGELTGQYGLHTSSVIIHTVGLVFTSFLVLFKREKPFKNMRPWYFYISGAVGVATVAFNNYAFRRISLSAMLALVLLGQSAAGLVFDQYGLLGLPKYPFRKFRLVGIIIMIAGVAVMTETHRFDITAVIFSFLAGCCIVFTRTLSGRLAELTSIRISTFFNYVLGLSAALILFLLLGGSEPSITEQGISSNLYIYTGGILGACLILVCNIVVMKIPAFYLSLLMFAGQVFSGVIIDAFIDKSFSGRLITGGILVTLGLCTDLLLIRKKSAGSSQDDRK